MKIKLLTDSVSSIPKEVLNELNIEVLEIQISHGNEFKREITEMDSFDFTERFHEINPVPTTSLASPNDALDILHKVIEEGYEKLFYPFLTTKTSNQVNSMRVASKRVKEKIDVIFYDTQLAGPSLAPLLLHTSRLIDEGKDIIEITGHLDKIKEYIYTIGVSEDFTTLFRTGKVKKNVQMTVITSLLKLKPLCEIPLNQGVIGFGGGIGFKGALKKIISRIREITDSNLTYDVIITHSNAKDKANTLLEKIKNEKKIQNIKIWNIPPAIVCTVGKGAVLATLYPNFESYKER
jgi:DegV family protein with EDD domain